MTKTSETIFSCPLRPKEQRWGPMTHGNGVTRPHVNTAQPFLAAGLMNPGSMVGYHVLPCPTVQSIFLVAGLLLIHHRVNNYLKQMCASKQWKEENLPQLEHDGNTAR